jgi:hypothetical protein
VLKDGCTSGLFERPRQMSDRSVQLGGQKNRNSIVPMEVNYAFWQDVPADLRVSWGNGMSLISGLSPVRIRCSIGGAAARYWMAPRARWSGESGIVH